MVILNSVYLVNDIYTISRNFTDTNYALTQIIENIKTKLPYKVSENIYITKASINGNDIYYTYRITNLKREKLSQINISLQNDNVLSATCNNLDSKKLIDTGYNFHYNYTNVYDEKYLSVLVNKEVCNKTNKDKEILKKLLSKS